MSNKCTLNLNFKKAIFLVQILIILLGFNCLNVFKVQCFLNCSVLYTSPPATNSRFESKLNTDIHIHPKSTFYDNKKVICLTFGPLANVCRKNLAFNYISIISRCLYLRKMLISR